jgi:hypothetical protein
MIFNCLKEVEMDEKIVASDSDQETTRMILRKIKEEWPEVTTESGAAYKSGPVTIKILQNILDNISIDDFLKGLIVDSDLVEVAACLDMIAQQNSRRVSVHDWGGRISPRVGVKLNFPCSDPAEGK